MTFINWISLSIVAIILVVGIGVNLYYRKKLRALDGFMGISSVDAEKDKNADE